MSSDRPVARVAFHTFGCRSNQADTADLQALVLGRGAEVVQTSEGADVIVVNTCAVTDSADHEALSLVRKLRSQYADSRVVVTGCFAEIGGDAIRAEAPGVAVVGPGDREKVLDEIFLPGSVGPVGSRGKAHRSLDVLQPLPTLTPAPGSAVGSVHAKSRYHLRIQEGCENSCTFCIIPTTRGQLASRPLSLIISDITALQERGYEEIVLTGTHIGGYGEDDGSSLAELLRAVTQVATTARIRLSSIDPNDVTPEIIEILRSGHVFCPHLHICTQALHDGTLKRMNRRYRVADIVQLMYTLEEKLPGCAIGTDLITGFPGERREDVEQGMETFIGLPFSYLHVFPYSEREGTAAVRLKDSVDPAERKRRAARWRAIGERRHRQFLERLVGKRIEFICERSADESSGEFLSGTSAEFAAVRCSFATLPSHVRERPSLVGKRIQALAVGVDDVRGELICR